MAKTVAPSSIHVPGIGTFQNTALPDPFDARDLEYRPRLQPLPDRIERRQGAFVMRQDGQSCTGHALAAVINTVLAQSSNGSHDEEPPRVSPYMLYHLARRYDEFEGESDVGSSLRGAFKGWFHHGVLPLTRWPGLDQKPVPDLDSDDVVAESARWPLGAFYRVNPYRLDDMQSAVSELNAICASALIHQGWEEPVEVYRNGSSMHVISRPVNARELGGHAFAIVGYSEVGFLVQNSWGLDWGSDGFAVLPYEDWLQSAFDAWVGRCGVPQTPFAGGQSQTVPATNGRLVTGPSPDLRRLAMHVVNLGNGGKLSTTGRFTSSPEQITRAFEHMDRWHEFWLDRGDTDTRHVMLYAHGGLNSEEHALDAADRNLNWWLNNNVYPLFFAWQSGVSETLIDHLADSVRGHLPFGLGFDFVEHVDRRVELIARKMTRWMWDEMKENARAASKPIDGNADANAPGASLTARHLREYIARHGNVKVHLVGHSAGAIFHAALLNRLVAEGIDVESIAFLAPAITVDGFVGDVLPHLGRKVGSFANFNLSDQRELDDVCGAGNLNLYHKSLLYLVSRALEGDHTDREVPILGMQKFFRTVVDGAGNTLERAIQLGNGAVVVSRSAAPPNSRSDASSHGGFAGDGPTMTSVLMRVLGLESPTETASYRPNAALTADAAPMAAARRPAPPMAGVNAPAAATAPSAAGAGGAGDGPLVETGETPAGIPAAPAQAGVRIEVASSPESGSPVLDILESRGWKRATN